MTLMRILRDSGLVEKRSAFHSLVEVRISLEIVRLSRVIGICCTHLSHDRCGLMGDERARILDGPTGGR